MNQLKGTIYLRDNAWYKTENVIKMGIATFAKDRSNTYITGEVERGEYICVIEIPLDKMKIIDKCLKHYFKSFHIYKGGGTEFYDRRIIDLIEPYFKNINIPYKIFTKEEINLMNRCERVRNISNVDKVKKAFNQLKIKNIIQNYKIRRSKNPLISASNNIANELSYMIEPNNHQQYVYDKVRTIVSQMRNVDENIEQKIFLSVGKKEKKEETKKEEKRSYYEDYIFEENMSELNKFKLRLRYYAVLKYNLQFLVRFYLFVLFLNYFLYNYKVQK